MFERFTEPAKQTITLAQGEARTMGHPYVGTEHLLLGLVADDAGPAGRAFKALGVTLETARAQVTAEVPPSANEPPAEIPFSPRAKGTLDAAPRQARGLKDAEVGTEHMLLALTAGPTRELARRTLSDMGLKHEQALRGVATALSAYSYARESMTFGGLSAPIRAALEDIRSRLARLEVAVSPRG